LNQTGLAICVQCSTENDSKKGRIAENKMSKSKTVLEMTAAELNER